MLSVEERQEAIPEWKVVRAVALSVSMSYKRKLPEFWKTKYSYLP
jgi:hypothetical protein